MSSSRPVMLDAAPHQRALRRFWIVANVLRMTGGLPTNHDPSRYHRATIAELYDQYAPQLLAFLVTRSKSRHDAQELTQEVWLRVQRNYNSFDGTNPRAWMYTIARNLLTDHYRKRQPEALGEDVDPEVHSENEREDDRKAVLAECLDTLDDDRRAVVERRTAGLSYEVIAEQLGISSGTVGSRFHRAVADLRRCVEVKLDA